MRSPNFPHIRSVYKVFTSNYRRVLVCGGRDFADRAYAFRTLNNLHDSYEFTTIIEGGARGADAIAREWAEGMDIPVETYPADWEAHGKQAGYLRNRKMLLDGKPDLIVAFNGGKGTKMMVTIAKNANVPVMKY
jgi:hypothetical protein